MSSENKLQDIIQTSLESLRTLVDSNTIIGKPISTDAGTTIIPVSKISMGFTTGGLDYAGKAAPTGRQNFGGAGATGLSIQPVGFLAIKADGDVEMINVGENPTSTVEQVADIIERSPEIFSKLKAFFKKDKPKKDAPADESAGETIEVNIKAEKED